MKKCLSLLLCLAMLASVFSLLGVTASAANANNVMYVESSGFTDNLVTYTVYLKKNISITGAVVKVQYDPNVLQPVSGGAYQITDAYGDPVDNISGVYAYGNVAGSNNACSLGFVRIDTYNTGSSDKAFMKITFKVIDKSYPVTNVKFHCVEYNGADETLNIPKNETNPQLFFNHTTATLDKVTISSIYSEENGLRINWNKVDGAEKYLVFKKTATGHECLGTVASTVNFFIDTTARPNVVEYYLVRAHNGAYDSGAVEFTASGIYVKAPDRVAVSLQPDSVKLGWTKVTGATGYKLFRRDVKNDGSRGQWVELSTAAATATTYFDKTVISGKHYEYTVRSVMNSGASAVCRYADIYYYKAPTVSAVSAVGGVNITWDSIGGAETYRIYRKYNGASSWTYIATVDKNTLKYLDTAAITGRNIDYAVRAFASNGSSTFVAKRCAYVATPILKSVSNAVSGVSVKWNAVSGATGYRVYRRGAGATYWTYLGTVKTTSYLDTKAASGAYWRYTVITEFYSVRSGFDTTGLYLKYVATPKLTGISNLSAGVNIKWNAVGGATGYRVYRRGAGQTSWLYLGTVSSTNFTDRNVVKNNYYRYTVRAVSGNVYSAFDTNGLVIKR
ncbi:MAG: hypothetical protein J6D06_03220 [Clostridia bacterium]|nr:hypothetical protein [Clostridia bacterium]